ALLFNEVKYVTILEDLHSIEDSLKGKANMIFAYVEAIGTPEHRAVMEAAFVYGTSYQFALTTEIALLENIGSETIERAHLYFFHCKLALDLTERCRRTLMEQPLTTLNIHIFVKTMKAPLLGQRASRLEAPFLVTALHSTFLDPAVLLPCDLPKVVSRAENVSVPVIGALLRVNQAILVSRHDLASAEEWLRRSEGGLPQEASGLRDSVDVSIPQHANVAFRRAEKEVPVEFLVLDDVDLIVAHVKNNMYIDEVQEDEDRDEEGPDLAIQDDEVAESVFRDRKRPLPLELTVELTQETFNSTVTTSDSIVLFYATWHAVSMAFLQSYIDVAIKLKAIETCLVSKYVKYVVTFGERSMSC
ncbi:hypothetical protein STEG23_034067, partial [Scotinomys teguina]